MNIVIVSGIQIINNPRVKKEADALAEAGNNVIVIDAIFTSKSKELTKDILEGAKWINSPVIDLTDGKRLTRILFFYARVKLKLLRLLKAILNIETPGSLGYFVKPMYYKAKKLNADLYIVHLEQALWSGVRLIENGYRVAVDIEDWYSEDGLIEDRRYRPTKLIKKYESFLLKKCCYSTTTSCALADTLSNVYHCARPEVVYNSYDDVKKKEKCNYNLGIKPNKSPSIVWFSQTIGPGRGLEILIKALNELNSAFQLNIIGNAREGYKESLLSIANDVTKSKINFYQQVSQSILQDNLRNHDIGYCGELSDCLNHDLTISNKLMEYLRTGLAVIATNTKGQMEVQYKLPESVFIFNQNDVDQLVQLLDKLLKNRNLLQNAKYMARKGFDQYYIWSKSKNKIIELTNRLVH